MALVIAAVVGWGLFLLTALLYWVGNRKNSEETVALALFAVALVLSDDFLTIQRSEMGQSIAAAPPGLTEEALAFRLVKTVTFVATRLNSPLGGMASLSTVLSKVKSLLDEEANS